MENPISQISYCKLCIDLGSKGIISISASNPMKEINDHIDIHCQQLLLLGENKISFVVKKTLNHNRFTFTIEKEFNQNATNNYESHKNKLAHDYQPIQVETDKMDTSENSQQCYKNVLKTSSINNETLKFNSRNNPLSRIRRLRCHQLIENFKESKEIPCRICKKMVPLETDGSSRLLTEHVYAQHLKKRIYVCRRCKQHCKCYHQLVGHVRSQHQTNKIKNQYDDHSNKFHDEIMSSLAECFDWNNKLERDKIKLTQARHKISTVAKLANVEKSDGQVFQRRTLCRRLAKEFKNGKTIQCRLCKKLVNHCLEAGNSAQLLTDHTIKHLNNPVYDCHICQTVCSSFSNLDRHSKLIHEKQIAREENDNRLLLHHEKIMSKISECFDWNDQAKKEEDRSLAFFKDQTPSTNQIKIKRQTSDLVFIQQAYCNRLIKTVDRAKKIACQICSKLIGVDNSGSRRLTDHSCKHLKKPCYRCLVCSKYFHTNGEVTQHLRNIHKVSASVNTYENLCDNYHDDIMAILSKCYDTTCIHKQKDDDEATTSSSELKIH